MNKAEKWAEIVAAWKNSGDKVTMWCKQNKIKLTTFKYWQYKFRRDNNKGITFKELDRTVKPTVTENVDETNLILNINGTKLEVTVNTDMNLLKNVIQVIKSC